MYHWVGVFRGGEVLLQENEDELAAYYEEHKDDPTVWEDVDQGPVTPKEGLGATITIRFTAEEAATIRNLAKRRHMTYSQLIRAALHEMLNPTVTFQSSTATISFNAERTETGPQPGFVWTNRPNEPVPETGTFVFSR